MAVAAPSSVREVDFVNNSPSCCNVSELSFIQACSATCCGQILIKKLLAGVKMIVVFLSHLDLILSQNSCKSTTWISSAELIRCGHRFS